MKKYLFLASATVALGFGMPALSADAELTVFDWAGWEFDSVLVDYVAKNGQNPTYSFFADDDEAFQKVNSGFKPDVAHPCAASVSRYRDAGLI